MIYLLREFQLMEQILGEFVEIGAFYMFLVVLAKNY
jgi:hypothetical protein